MPRPLKLALVIPTLREACALPMLLERTLSALAGLQIPWEVLVVDDDSGDGTEEIVGRMARRDTRFRLLVRRSERGLAGAILHGWRNSEANLLGVMDADLQHPPEVVQLLMEEILRGADLAIGSRYAEGAGLKGWNPLRRLVSKGGVGLTWPLLSTRMRPRDPLSGFFLVRRSCVEGVRFHSSGFKLLLEILVRGKVHSVSEVPIAFGARTAGRSKAGIGVAMEYMRLLAGLYGNKLRRSGPSFSRQSSLAGADASSSNTKLIAEC